ncbi:MAG: hypothetical protein JO210_11555 [Acidobacteriaceae bacterium]|nr:hypothetical protein [Acidobacteriaceae bacterium]
MPTAAQIAANQRNAQLSTGPTSESGKAKSCLNAIKTGLTGRTVLLPTEDVAAYSAHIARFEADWKPATDAERVLVQSLADTEWRLLRIPLLEAGIYAIGRLEFAELFASEDDSLRQALIQAKTLLTYQRQLNNLSVQEGRLRRQCEKDTAALREMQTDRMGKRKGRLYQAVGEFIQAVSQNRHAGFDPAALGFEFSFAEIESRAIELRPDIFAKYKRRRVEVTEAA